MRGRLLSSLLFAACTCACSRKAEAPAPSVPAPRPEAPAPAPAACRALLSLANESEYRTVDVRLGGERSVARSAPGLVLRDGKDTYALQVSSKHTEGKSEYGSGTLDLDALMVMRLSEKSPRVLVEGEGELSVPDDDFGGPVHEINGYVKVTAVVGPYLSIEHGVWGYAGGAHAIESKSAAILRVPSAKSVAADVLGPAVHAEVARQLTEDNAERKQRDDLEPIEMPPDLSSASLTVWQANRAGLLVHTSIDCCSWAENHNYHDMAVPIHVVPPALAPYLRFSADARLLESPDGACGLGLENSKVLARRVGAPGVEVLTVDAPLREARLLGVTWLDPKDAFELSQLPRWDELLPRPAAHKLSPEERKRVMQRMPPGSALAHEVFRANLGPSERALLLLVRRDDKLEGLVLDQDHAERSWPLPLLQDAGTLDEVSAVLFDDLDDDPAREAVVLTRIKLPDGTRAAHNLVLDWTGQAFVRLAELERKVQGAESAKQVRALLK